MKLKDYINANHVWVLDAPDSRDALLELLCARVADSSAATDKDGLLKALLDREAKASTATPLRVALPHAMLPDVEDSFIVVALLTGGVDFEGEHGKDIDMIFMLVGPTNKAWEHVRLLARVARICQAPGALKNLRGAESADELYQRLVKEDERHV